MNGLVADIGEVKPPQKKTDKRLVILAVVIGAAVLLPSVLLSLNTPDEPVLPQDIQLMNDQQVTVRNYYTFSANWSEVYVGIYESRGPTISDTLVTFPDPQLIECSSATLTFDVLRFSYWKPNETNGAEPPYDNPELHVPVPVSLYAIEAGWDAEHITFSGLRQGTPAACREPIGVAWCNETAELEYNITEAVQGGWNWTHGLLLAIVAPWETTDYDYLNRTVSIMLIIGTATVTLEDVVAIPEFSIILIPIVAMLIIALTMGRYRCRKAL